ncbi:MAG TPA: hypothetical protein VNA30_02855 [Mycobacteriales bacterium]|nr:hypothetical protein [Mycobacteriales bacterium]
MRALAACVLALSLAACGGKEEPTPLKQPAEDSFAAGTCRTGAPDVLALGRTVHLLGNGPTVTPERRSALSEAQDRLAAVAEGAEPMYKPAFDRLVVAVGVVRIRADSNTYEKQFGERAAAAYDEVLAVCGAKS